MLLLFKWRTNKIKENVVITEDYITHIVETLIAKKSHDWDSLSTGKSKLCSQSISYRLKHFFAAYLQEDVLPESQKKKNRFLFVYKKESKIILKSCSPISVLPFFLRILWAIIQNRNFRKIPIRFLTKWLMLLSITFYCVWEEFILW